MGSKKSGSGHPEPRAIVNPSEISGEKRQSTEMDVCAEPNDDGECGTWSNLEPAFLRKVGTHRPRVADSCRRRVSPPPANALTGSTYALCNSDPVPSKRSGETRTVRAQVEGIC